MLKEFKKHISEKFPMLLDSTFILACSGGVDSVVLVYLCHACNLNFSIAHCNFKLRAKASDGDEKFVKGLAKELNKKFYSTYFDTITYAKTNKVSIQMAARALRYTWFDELRDANAAEFLVTAHQADDDLETFVINLSRGTGIEGLIGIPEQTTTTLRPLLNFSREQLLDFAREHGIPWREDASNADTKYLRNKIRHEIAPKLKELHPTFDKNFDKTQEYLAGTASILKHHIIKLKEELFQAHKDHIKISVASLKALNPINPYLYELFKDYGFTAWDDVYSLLFGMSGKEVISATYRLIKDREYILLQKLVSKKGIKEHYYLDDESEGLPVLISQESVEEITETSREILYIDKETLNHRLNVRKWEKGDYFYPLGMKGKKKLSKFFKDEKVDLISKEAQWLLCSGKEIVWVIGRRADDRFKVTKKTKTILKFKVLHEN